MSRAAVLLLVTLLSGGAPAVAGERGLSTDATATDRATVVKLMGASTWQDADPKRDLEIAKADLNGDGVPDYVATINSSMFCGSHGCAIAIYLSTGKTYVEAADLLGGWVELAPGSTRGVRNLVLRGGREDARLVWDGKSYRVAGAAK